MYPFYYPFASTFGYGQYPTYSYDANNVNQQYNQSKQQVFEEKQQKCQEFNTNYSLNGLKQEEKEDLKALLDPPEQIDFFSAKDEIPQIQNYVTKIEENQPKIILKRTKSDRNQKFSYINKNYESNIINKIFAFLWSEDKSKDYVIKILKNKIKEILYFDYIKIVRKYSKRYINKEYLQNLCEYQPQHIAYRIVAKNTEKLKYFSMDELSQTIRKLIYIYLKDVCFISILTSKKMKIDKWKNHFQKSRNIYEFLFEGLSSEQYDERMSSTYKKNCQNCRAD